eukprot:6547377-Pyramimonas_sp.AAC.1
MSTSPRLHLRRPSSPLSFTPRIASYKALSGDPIANLSARGTHVQYHISACFETRWKAPMSQ